MKKLNVFTLTVSLLIPCVAFGMKKKEEKVTLYKCELRKSILFTPDGESACSFEFKPIDDVNKFLLKHSNSLVFFEKEDNNFVAKKTIPFKKLNTFHRIDYCILELIENNLRKHGTIKFLKLEETYFNGSNQNEKRMCKAVKKYHKSLKK